MSTYSTQDANRFWTRRAAAADDLSAVLYYGLPAAFNRAYSQWELSVVTTALGTLVGRRVMDVGCGNGRVTLRLAQAGAVVTAIDNSEGMVTQCRARVDSAGVGDRVALQHCSAHELPCEKSTYDAVVCLGLLEHLPVEVREEAIRRMTLAVRPGGLVVATASNPESVLLQQWQAASRRRNTQDQQLVGFHIDFVTPAWLQEALSTRGFICEIAAANPFLAFALHAFRGGDLAATEEQWERLFQLCCEFDLKVRGATGLASVIGELFIICARKAE